MINKPGYHKGKHFTEYVSKVKGLKRSGKLEEAEMLLLSLIRATEEESIVDNLGVAPWYYGELAIIYRKQKKYGKEVAILERFVDQKHARGVKPPKLIARLNRAKELLRKSSEAEN